MPLISGNLGQQTGNNIKMHALEAFAQGRFEVLRPELLWLDVFPGESFNNTIPRGSTDYSKIIEDWAGQAGWRAQGSNDVPTVSTTLFKTSVPIFRGGVTNSLDYRDIDQSQILATRGFSDDAVIRTGQILRLASQYFKERLMFFGDTTVDSGAAEFYPGLINHPLIPQSTVPVGGGGFTPWNTKTPDEILFDISTAFATLNSSTNTVMLTSDVYLPVDQFHLITSTKAGVRGNDEVIWRFTSEQNATAVIRGRTINFHMLRYLSGVGVGATDRMIVMDRKPEYFMIGEPMDFSLYDVQKVGFQFNYFGEFEIGPVHFPYPQFALYVDGI